MEDASHKILWVKSEMEERLKDLERGMMKLCRERPTCCNLRDEISRELERAVETVKGSIGRKEDQLYGVIHGMVRDVIRDSEVSIVEKVCSNMRNKEERSVADVMKKMDDKEIKLKEDLCMELSVFKRRIDGLVSQSKLDDMRLRLQEDRVLELKRLKRELTNKFYSELIREKLRLQGQNCMDPMRDESTERKAESRQLVGRLYRASGVLPAGWRDPSRGDSFCNKRRDFKEENVRSDDEDGKGASLAASDNHNLEAVLVDGSQQLKKEKKDSVDDNGLASPRYEYVSSRGVPSRKACKETDGNATGANSSPKDEVYGGEIELDGMIAARTGDLEVVAENSGGRKRPLESTEANK